MINFPLQSATTMSNMQMWVMEFCDHISLSVMRRRHQPNYTSTIYANQQRCEIDRVIRLLIYSSFILHVFTLISIHIIKVAYSLHVIMATSYFQIVGSASFNHLSRLPVLSHLSKLSVVSHQSRQPALFYLSKLSVLSHSRYITI